MRNYSDSENSYNKKEQDSYRNQAVNCHSTKEENSATNCHRDKDTSEKNSKDEGRMPVIPEMPQNPIRHEMQPITARDSNM